MKATRSGNCIEISDIESRDDIEPFLGELYPGHIIKRAEKAWYGWENDGLHWFTELYAEDNILKVLPMHYGNGHCWDIGVILFAPQIAYRDRIAHMRALAISRIDQGPECENSILHG